MVVSEAVQVSPPLLDVVKCQKSAVDCNWALRDWKPLVGDSRH